MKTRSNVSLMTSAALLLGLAGAGNAFAQPAGSNLPDPGIDRDSCSDINWHQDMLRHFPWVAEACHETVVVEGRKWTRFEAEFETLNRDGTITTDFRDHRGRSLGSIDLAPGPGQRVLLDGQPTRFSDLDRGQVLNFYAEEGELAFSTEPGARPSEQLQVAQRGDEPRRDRQRLEEQRLAEQRRATRDDRDDRTLAQAAPPTTTRRDTLPATAGPLPIVALGGVLSLLGGMTLTIRRRRASKHG